ncbi:MAG: ion channel [Planctomycetota bacterium]
MKRFRFAYLLAALVLIAFVRPFLVGQLLGVGVIDLLLFVTLLAGAFAAVESRVRLMIVSGLAVLSAVSQVLLLAADVFAASIVFLVTTIAFYGMVAGSLLTTMFHGRRVTGDTICQAISIYLLLGLLGTMGFALLEAIVPGSFTFANAAAEANERFDRFLGFSFVTLTTLGYGNISPATPRADALATALAAAGQIYLAIVVARLVGIQVGQQQAKVNS